MMRRAALSLFVLLATTLPIGTAWACSCEMLSPEQFIGASEGGPVFVGTLLERAPSGGIFDSDDPEQMASWTFEVETVLAGELPAEITLEAGSDGAMCGLALEPGARVGLKLFPGDGQGWSSNGCLVYDADALLAVAEGHPPTTDAADPPPDDASGATATDTPWLGLVLTVAAGVGVLGGAVLLARRRRPAS